MFNILLVDDEKPLIETIAERLRQREYTVDCVFSGTDALSFLEKNQAVDVIMLDVKMPGVDGIQILAAIKEKYPLVEVVMLTGHATVTDAVEAMKVGAYDYATKPCDLEDLMNKATQAYYRKKDREDKINTIQTKPYLSEKQRQERIAKILERSHK